MLRAALVSLAVVAGGLAALLETGGPNQSLDPHPTGAFTLVLVAVAFASNLGG